MEIWIQTLTTHFRDLLDLTARHVIQQPSQIRPGVHSLELFLVQMQHLVHPSLVLELKYILRDDIYYSFKTKQKNHPLECRYRYNYQRCVTFYY